MKKINNKHWKFLKKQIKIDEKMARKLLTEAERKGDYLECIQNKECLSVYFWILQAMEEIEGRQWHNIFDKEEIEALNE